MIGVGDKGWCWPNFSNSSMARKLGPAQPRGTTWNGAGGCVIASQSRQENFSRTVWMTFHSRGIAARLELSRDRIGRFQSSHRLLGLHRLETELCKERRIFAISCIRGREQLCAGKEAVCSGHET